MSKKTTKAAKTADKVYWVFEMIDQCEYAALKTASTRARAVNMRKAICEIGLTCGPIERIVVKGVKA